MGKMVIILIVGLTIIVGIMTISIVGRSADASKSSASAFKKTSAKNVASGAADYYIRQVKATPTLRGTFSLSPILNGSASVTLQDWTYGVTDSIRLTSIGTYNAAQETVTVKLSQGSSFPLINSAINFRTPGLSFTRSETCLIDGHNHDASGNLLASSSNDRTGASVSTASDTSVLLPSYESNLDGTKDAIVDYAIPDPLSFAASLISKADQTISGEQGGESTWGSPTSPKIIYCNGTVKFTGECTGWGILICNVQTFESTDEFTFTGLVIVYSSSTTVSWKTSNTMKVYGALLLSSPSTASYNSTGTANILYSKAGLDLAKQVAGSVGGGVTVANWFE